MSDGTCSMPNCERLAKTRTLCPPCLRRLRKHGLPVPPLEPRVKRTCEVEGCDRRHCAHGLCRLHYAQAGYGFTPQLCAASNCDRMTSKHSVGGLCDMHCGRMRRFGSLESERFSPFRDQSLFDVLHLRSEPHGECILWTGSISPDGYGRINWSVWGHSNPHRYSWSLVNGPIPEGYEIDHVCHNMDPDCEPASCLHRRCINPAHLEAVTHDENMRRQVARLRAAC